MGQQLQVGRCERGRSGVGLAGALHGAPSGVLSFSTTPHRLPNLPRPSVEGRVGAPRCRFAKGGRRSSAARRIAGGSHLRLIAEAERRTAGEKRGEGQLAASPSVHPRGFKSFSPPPPTLSPPPPSGAAAFFRCSASHLLVQPAMEAFPVGDELGSTPEPTILQPAGTAPAPAYPALESQQGEHLRVGEDVQFSEEVEDRGLLESSTRLKPHEAQNYRKKALWVSWASIIVTLALAVAAFTVSVMRYSASSFGFAFDATLDVLSSVIVLWRYSNAAAVHSAHREYIACVILGVIFLLSALCIVIKAIHDLATRLLPEVDDFLYSVSILSGILCTALAVIKFMLGKVLTSRALLTDGFNSLVGGIMGFSILLSAEVFKHNASVWYLDGSIGVLIGLTIFAYGAKLLLDMVPRVRQTRHYEMFE